MLTYLPFGKQSDIVRPMLGALNSLGFAKPPGKTRVVVAMSGGVDSSVTAALLQEEGYEVIGITLQLYDHGEAIAKKGACCAGKDIYDARRVAEDLGFPHYVLNYQSRFQQSVIDDFVASYLKGETPIPCVRCNQSVKFHDLLATARELGADCMATGHYVRRVVNAAGRAELQRAADPLKDQSYFLFATTQDQLEFLRFPLGASSKETTRKEAARLGLLNAEKADSQDICFVPEGDYAALVRKLAPESGRPGPIRHKDGRILGHHRGIIGYTVGQRRGIGVGGGYTENNEPLYVLAIDAEKAEVIVGPKADLAKDRVFLSGCNWLFLPQGQEETGMELDVEVKLRSMTRAVPARLFMKGDGRAELALSSPQYGISPGQAAVCYQGEQVLGGGWIATATSQETKNPQERQQAA